MDIFKSYAVGVLEVAKSALHWKYVYEHISKLH
jgi:hypothetical protein